MQFVGKLKTYARDRCFTDGDGYGDGDVVGNGVFLGMARGLLRFPVIRAGGVASSYFPCWLTSKQEGRNRTIGYFILVFLWDDFIA